MLSESHRHPLRCWAEINLSALEGNIRRIRQTLPPHVRYMAVVKADAYGHGLPQTVARLMHSGVDLFAVANVQEAAAIRELGSGWPVLLLSALLPEEEDQAIALQAIPTISGPEEVERLGEKARQRGIVLGVHLKIDTGMGRLGVWHTAAQDLWQRLHAHPSLRVDGIYTHFSSADSDPDFTAQQRALFLSTYQQLDPAPGPETLLHSDNSAGLESFRGENPFNAVRVGLLQFGILPYPRSLLARVRTEPTFRFVTKVSLVKEIPTGTPVGYGQTFRTARPTRLAILSAGYGDGIPRSLSNRGKVLIGGREHPIIGTVTMDQTMVDVTDGPAPRAGEEAVLIGQQGSAEISIETFSAWAGTIPWEILCSVTKRVPRLYRTPLGI